MSKLVGIGRHWAEAAVTVGAVGIVVTVAVAMTADWGPPGTAEYHTYESLNRLVAAPAVALLVGLLALRRQQREDRRRPRTFATRLGAVGAGLALAGNVGEFWFFSTTAYGDGWRNLAWTAFGLGALTLLASAAVALVGLILDRIHPPPSAAR